MDSATIFFTDFSLTKIIEEKFVVYCKLSIFNNPFYLNPLKLKLCNSKMYWTI